MDDESLKRALCTEIPSDEWISAKDLHDKLGDGLRIYRIKSAARLLLQDGLIELESRQTQFGYPDEHYRLNAGAAPIAAPEADQQATPAVAEPQVASTMRVPVAMTEILHDLNENAGIMGSLLVSDDGMVIAASIGEQLDQDTVAAIAARLIRSLTGNIQVQGLNAFSRFIFRATHGRIVIMNLEMAFLVVVTKPEIKLDVILIEIDSTCRRIKTRR